MISVMKIPETVEWAIHCAWLLSQTPPPAALPARKLAEFHGVPEAYLAKTLKVLVRAGVLTAVSGPRGGYRLARPPEAITVLDLLTAIDGETPPFRCQEIRQRGPVALPASACRSPCGIAAVMQRAERAWRNELARTTIADLMTHAGVASTDRARRWVAEVVATA